MAPDDFECDAAGNCVILVELQIELVHVLGASRRAAFAIRHWERIIREVSALRGVHPGSVIRQTATAPP